MVEEPQPRLTLLTLCWVGGGRGGPPTEAYHQGQEHLGVQREHSPVAGFWGGRADILGGNPQTMTGGTGSVWARPWVPEASRAGVSAGELLALPRMGISCLGSAYRKSAWDAMASVWLVSGIPCRKSEDTHRGALEQASVGDSPPPPGARLGAQVAQRHQHWGRPRTQREDTEEGGPKAETPAGRLAANPKGCVWAFQRG